MYDKTPLNTLQLSFLLISQQRYYMGTIIPILQIKKKKYWESERFKCHVQVKIIGHWEDLKFPSPVSLTAVSTDWRSHCVHSECRICPHLILLESEGKEHTCCSVLGSVFKWEYVQKLRAESWGSGKYATGGMGNWSTNVSFGKGKAIEVCWLHSSIFALALKGDGLCQQIHRKQLRNPKQLFLHRIHRINPPGSNLACH